MKSSRGPTRLAVGLLATFVSQTVLAQSTSNGPSLMSSATTLKLATTYSGSSFFSGFNFFTANDPTGGYVNYLSQADAQAKGLAAVQNDGSFRMAADTSSVASGRGRNSVRISSKSKWADGVYILDLNHIPVGCGTWPAFWTVVENGWPTGGEIDIIEGANAPPSLYSQAWNATGNLPTSATSTVAPSLMRDTASLHTASNCQLNPWPYQNGTTGSTACSAYLNDNSGCGVMLGGNTTYPGGSFGAGVNAGGGGWYAMWRDFENSGGVYIYYWPRGSASVPDDVKNPSTQTTNVAGWGQPAANLSVPSCKGDFGDHVIVFNIAFCGDYSAATYTASGCPGSCTSFVMNNPQAFTEAYWSINSLRVYTASGQAVPPPPVLSTAQIAGIAAGGAAFILICSLLAWRYWYCRRRRARLAAESVPTWQVPPPSPGGASIPKYTAWAAGSAPGSAANSALDLVPVASRERQYTTYERKASRGTITESKRARKASNSSGKSKRRYRDSAAFTDVPISAPVDVDGRPVVLNERGKRTVLATAKARTGKTTLQPGKTAWHHLEGETQAGYYHERAAAAAAADTSGIDVAPGAYVPVPPPIPSPTPTRVRATTPTTPTSARSAGRRPSTTYSQYSSPDTARRPSYWGTSGGAGGAPSYRTESVYTNRGGSFSAASQEARRGSTFHADRAGNSWIG